MLASTQNLLQMCSFDATKSTKGASKLRRDLINSEIANLRDLLPLPSSTRQRLSQLQLMALVCVYVRKANYFQHAFRKHELIPQEPSKHFGFSKALSGFLMMMTQNGKLLYISDNAAEYLGHSMEDLLIHGDSVYDIIEKQDHQTIQNELVCSANPLNTPTESRIFLCRMNVSRNSRRQMRFGDQKVILVQGHFVSYLPLCSRNEPVFLATCTPVAMPETRECVVQGSTNVFTSIHSMDMKFIHLDSNGEFHLGYNKSHIKNLSWYDIVHWEHAKEAQSKHRLITQSEQERSCILLLRLQTSDASWIWVHVVLQVKDNNENSQQPVIVCTNQVLSEKEAAVMQANSWLYQFYSLHSKMHYAMQNSNVSVSIVSPSSSTASTPTAATTTTTSYESNTISTCHTSSTSGNRSFSSNNYSPGSNSFALSGHHGGQHSAYHSSVPTAGSEAPALAIHPTHPNMYYHQHVNNGMGVSVNTGQYGHFGPGLQQYSPQAGTLPYQTTPHQTNSNPSTPPATSQTEVRVKEETPTASTSTRAVSKRNRSYSQQDEDHKKHKSHKKNSHTSSTQEHTLNGTNTATNGTTGSSSSSNSSSRSYSSYSNSTSHHSNYGAYHPSGSMFGAAYYGGSMPYHHSQLTYSHPFQSKFPFFEHGTAGSNSMLSGGSEPDRHHQPSGYTGRQERNGSNEDSGTMLFSSFSSSLPHLNKPTKSSLYHSELSDRRELDKVRSPESITSATSDYGSMTSQSPPSTFEKPFTSLSNTTEPSEYSQSHYKNNWSGYQATNPAEKVSAERPGLHFSMSFQFWPGYSSVPSANLSHESQHRRPHIPVGTTFPVDSLLPGQTSMYNHSNLFASYGENYNADSKSLVSRSSVKTSNKTSDTKLVVASNSPVNKCTSPTQPAISVTRAL